LLEFIGICITTHSPCSAKEIKYMYSTHMFLLAEQTHPRPFQEKMSSGDGVLPLRADIHTIFMPHLFGRRDSGLRVFYTCQKKCAKTPKKRVGICGALKDSNVWLWRATASALSALPSRARMAAPPLDPIHSVGCLCATRPSLVLSSIRNKKRTNRGENGPCRSARMRLSLRCLLLTCLSLW